MWSASIVIVKIVLKEVKQEQVNKDIFVKIVKEYLFQKKLKDSILKNLKKKQ